MSDRVGMAAKYIEILRHQAEVSTDVVQEKIDEAKSDITRLVKKYCKNQSKETLDVYSAAKAVHYQLRKLLRKMELAEIFVNNEHTSEREVDAAISIGASDVEPVERSSTPRYVPPHHCSGGDKAQTGKPMENSRFYTNDPPVFSSTNAQI
jgi:hypothetical protein